MVSFFFLFKFIFPLSAHDGSLTQNLHCVGMLTTVGVGLLTELQAAYVLILDLFLLNFRLIMSDESTNSKAGLGPRASTAALLLRRSS
jgi:hypothetical protein